MEFTALLSEEKVNYSFGNTEDPQYFIQAAEPTIKLVFVSSNRLCRSIKLFLWVGLFLKSRIPPNILQNTSGEHLRMADHRGVSHRRFIHLPHVYSPGSNQAHTKCLASDTKACTQLEFVCREKQWRRFRGLRSALELAGTQSQTGSISSWPSTAQDSARTSYCRRTSFYLNLVAELALESW